MATAIPMLDRAIKVKPTLQRERAFILRRVELASMIAGEKEPANGEDCMWMAFVLYNDGVQTTITISAAYGRDTLDLETTVPPSGRSCSGTSGTS